MGLKDSVLILANEMAGTHNHTLLFNLTKLQLQSILSHLVTISSNATLMKSMYGIIKALSLMSQSRNINALQNCITELEKKYDLEIMKDEVVDTIMKNIKVDTDEEECNDAIENILKEIGIIVWQTPGVKHDAETVLQEILYDIPNPTPTPIIKQENTWSVGDEEDLIDRLNRLRDS